MLSSLTLHNIVTISSLHIDFCRGLSVLTGETGAGKSILLDSLGLVLGDRANPNLIRSGEDQASIIAVFSIQGFSKIKEFLEDQDIYLEEDELILRRKLYRDGRSKIFLNDVPASLNLVRQIAFYLVDIHGQFDRLLEPKQHLAALDTFAKIDTEKLKIAYHNWKESLKKYKKAEVDKEKGQERYHFLQDSIKKLKDLNSKENEEEELLSKRKFLINFEKIKKTLDQVDEKIYAGQVQDALMGAYKSISKIADDSEIFHSIQISLDQSIQALQDALAEIKNQKDFLHKEEDLTLEQIESRLFAMREQARRHHCDTPDLPKKLEELEEEFYNLEAGDDYINTLKESEKEAKKLFFQEASNTYKERLIATRKLVEKVKQELVPLKLDRINFDINFEELSEEKWNEEGIHKVEFYISTNVGQKLGPLQSVASGGELSRIMLALKVILNESQPHQRTLIFDEIDTGLGGAVADAMGYRLKLLSNKSQVLSVTHSPQIAVYSDYHYVVHKEHKQNHTETAIHFLQEQKDREQEIARMISGASVTKEAEAAAAKLLKESMHG